MRIVGPDSHDVMPDSSRKQSFASGLHNWLQHHKPSNPFSSSIRKPLLRNVLHNRKPVKPALGSGSAFSIRHITHDKMAHQPLADDSYESRTLEVALAYSPARRPPSSFYSKHPSIKHRSPTSVYSRGTASPAQSEAGSQLFTYVIPPTPRISSKSSSSNGGDGVPSVLQNVLALRRALSSTGSLEASPILSAVAEKRQASALPEIHGPDPAPLNGAWGKLADRRGVKGPAWCLRRLEGADGSKQSLLSPLVLTPGYIASLEEHYKKLRPASALPSWPSLPATRLNSKASSLLLALNDQSTSGSVSDVSLPRSQRSDPFDLFVD